MLNQLQINEINQFARNYVNSKVKTNLPNSRYIVDMNTFDSIASAVKESLARCPRPSVPIQDVAEMDQVLENSLRNLIENLP